MALATLGFGGAASALGTARASSAPLPGAVTGARAIADTGWTVYHGDQSGQGNDTSKTSLSPASKAWTSPSLDGQLYGEPLESGGRVFVATETDTVYALAAQSGSILWSTTVGTPAPSSDLPCGDISPTVGITGTPVVDPSKGEIFVVADQLINGKVAHQLLGLDIYSGAVLLRQSADPPGSYPPAILQRTGLNLDQGNVIFGYGGNNGDCSSYHGWIVRVPEDGGAMTTFQVDSGPGESQGAVWMGGAAPEVTGNGDVWLAAGNGSNNTKGDPYDDSDSVLDLTSTLSLRQYFAPSDWYSDNANDRDLGSSVPALMPNGTVVQAGKSQTAYLMNQSNLGGIGGQTSTLNSYCGSDDDGGNAIAGNVVFTPCLAGVEALTTTASPASLTKLWQNSSSGGPPIVADDLVWTINHNTGDLFALNPTTGAPVQSFSIGAVANHFPTPSVGDGLLLAPASNDVVAFDGPGGLPGPPSPRPSPPPAGLQSSYWTVAADGGVFAFGNATFYGSMGGKHLNSPIVGLAPTPTGHGYWLVAADGGIFSFGDATFYGSTGALHLNSPIVAMTPTPDGGGYWLAASDGGVFAYGDATFHGSLGSIPLNRPIVGMTATTDGLGYWMVAADGGIFAFGDATFHGSTGSLHLAAPIVAMAADPHGEGYWLVGADGGIFAFGTATYLGSMGGKPLVKPVVSLAATSDGKGYWMVASDGGIFSFGDAGFSGSTGGIPLVAPMVGLAPVPAT